MKKWVLSLCLLFLCGCAQDLQLTNQTFVFELGTDVFANPSLYLDNADTVNVSRLSIEAASPGITLENNRFVTSSLDYLDVGTYDFVLKDGSREIPFVIKIKDTQAPVVRSAASSIEVPWQSSIRWSDYFQADDLSGVYYDGPADAASTAGEQDVEVKIRDRFGNSTSRTVHLIVK